MKIIRTREGANEWLKEVPHENNHEFKHVQMHVTDNLGQTIIGFGGAFTESSAYNLGRINKEERLKAIKAYFDPEEGLGYTIGRVSIHGCDFSLSSYLYIEDYDDTLESFSIERDEPILDLIKDATIFAGKKISLLASPWTPPFWMKDNQSPIRGGKLLEKYDQTWANYIVKFILAYQRTGGDVTMVTIQNEPAAVQRWDSCIYDGSDEARFVKVLGKTLKNHDLSHVKIYIWDHNRDVMVQRAKEVCSDQEANQYIYGTAFHWYDNEQFDEVKKHHDLFPEKHLLFTEGCQEGGPHFFEYAVGERYGRNIIHDLKNFNEGFIDWNLFLDDTGGPNHVNNLCSSPIMLKIFAEEIIKNPSYYYIGQFSKYIKPGAIQLLTEGNKDVYYVAFRNPSQQIVIVIMNESNNDYNVDITGLKTPLTVVSHRHSINTIEI